MTGFVQISKSKIPLLYSTVERRLPSAATFCNIVHTFLNGRFSENVQTTFYSYNEIIDDDSLFAAVQNRNFSSERDSAMTLCGPPDLSVLTEEIIRQFENSMRWDIPISFCSVDDKLAEHMQLPEMCSRQGRLDSVDPCYFYYMPIDKALSFDIDQEIGGLDEGKVVVSRLLKEDAELVTKHWKFSGVGTLDRMGDAIHHIPGSAGVRLVTRNGEERDLDSKLVSWVVTSHAGSINALFTDKNHRRKGYGKLTMEGACKLNALAGTIPNVQIQLANDASKVLMEDLGFVFSHNINWFIYEPNTNCSMSS